MPFKSKNSKYWQYDFQIRGRRFSGSCKTESFEEAKEVEATKRVTAKSRSEFTGKFTLFEAIGTYCTDVCVHQPSARTSESQALRILCVLPGTTPIEVLKDADVLKLIRVMRAQVSNATVNRHVAFLMRAVQHMAKYQATVPKIDYGSMKLKEPKERVRELSWREQGRLFQHLRRDFHNHTKFALMTGARLKTITDLKWSDVDLDGRRIVFRLKGDDEMVFPINNEMMAFLSALPKSNALEHRQYVFTYINQKSMDRQRIGQGGGFHTSWRSALITAGIENFRFHDLRHTFATRLLRKCGNLKTVSQLLGHKNIESTMRYAHIFDEDKQYAMADFSIFENSESRRKSRDERK